MAVKTEIRVYRTFVSLHVIIEQTNKLWGFTKIISPRKINIVLSDCLFYMYICLFDLIIQWNRLVMPQTRKLSHCTKEKTKNKKGDFNLKQASNQVFAAGSTDLFAQLPISLKPGATQMRYSNCTRNLSDDGICIRHKILISLLWTIPTRF